MRQWREQQTQLEARKKQKEALRTSSTNKAFEPDVLMKTIHNDLDGSGGAIEMETINRRNVEKEDAAINKMNDNENKPKPPLAKMLIKVYGPMILLNQLITAIYVVAYFCIPLLLWYDIIIIFINAANTVLCTFE